MGPTNKTENETRKTTKLLFSSGKINMKSRKNWFNIYIHVTNQFIYLLLARKCASIASIAQLAQWLNIGLNASTAIGLQIFCNGSEFIMLPHASAFFSFLKKKKSSLTIIFFIVLFTINCEVWTMDAMSKSTCSPIYLL